MTLQAQLTKEMQRLKINGTPDNIKVIGDMGLITFTIADHSKSFWARLTPTGKLKKHSIRINY